MGSLTGWEAVKIAEQSYEADLKNIPVVINGKRITWEKVEEPIIDKETGLKGYVLQNKDTGKVVISFEGTQKDRGMEQLVNDLETDAFGIFLGNQSYTGNDSDKYTGSPIQDMRIANGLAEIDEDGNVRTLTENQFTKAAPIVDKYIEEYGKDNVTFVGHSLGGGLAEYFAVQHDADAITFAAADVYNLLTDKQQQRVKNGDFKDQIITYTYPDDIVGTYRTQPIGSLYYMSDPSEIGIRWFETHGISKNYVIEELFDENGYLKPGVLYDAELGIQLKSSPLEMKNNDVHGFSIVIQSEIIKSFAKDLEENTDLIKNTEKSFDNFYDYYIQTLTDIKSKYLRLVGSGNLIS